MKNPGGTPISRFSPLSRTVCVILALLVAGFLLRAVFGTLSLTALSQSAAWNIPRQLCVPVSLLLMATVGWNGWRAVAGGPASGGALWWNRLSASRGVWIALVTLTLLTCRWGTLAVARHNLDEAESISAARVLAHDGRFWQSVDVGTHGPMISLGQRLLPLFDLTVDFPSSHLLAVFLWIGVVFAAYGILRRAAAGPIARLLVLPAVFLLGSLRGEEYACYNGEHCLVFLMMTACACLVAALLPPRGSEGTVAERASQTLLALGGILSGSLVWAKIQGLPLAAALVCIGVVGICLLPSPDTAPARTRGRRLLCFLSGFALPSALLLLWLGASGTLPLMLKSYLQWNLAYAARFSNVGTPRFYAGVVKWAFHNFWVMTRYSLIFCLSFWVGAAAWLARRGWRGMNREQAFLLCGVGFLTLAAWFCAIKPGNRYQHYLLIPLIPGFLVNALLWCQLVARHEERTSPATRAPRRHPAAYWALLAVVAPWLLWSAVNIPSTGRMRYLLPSESETYMVSDDIVARVQAVARPDETITVWGWAPDLYVYANRLPATRTAANLREAVQGFPMQPYFYQLFLSDFDRNRPVIFVDEVRVPPHAGNNKKSTLAVVYENIVLHDPTLPNLPEARFTHENYPELNQRIRSGYMLFYTSPEGIRLFVRNDCRARVAVTPSL